MLHKLKSRASGGNSLKPSASSAFKAVIPLEWQQQGYFQRAFCFCQYASFLFFLQLYMHLQHMHISVCTLLQNMCVFNYWEKLQACWCLNTAVKSVLQLDSFLTAVFTYGSTSESVGKHNARSFDYSHILFLPAPSQAWCHALKQGHSTMLGNPQMDMSVTKGPHMEPRLRGAKQTNDFFGGSMAPCNFSDEKQYTFFIFW